MSKLFYLYGIIPQHEQNESQLPSLKGLDDKHDVYLLPFGEIVALGCNLDEQDYGEEQLHEKTNQMEWVQDKAYHHHNTLLTIREHFTVIPMKFCTIYSSEASLKQMLESQHENQELESYSRDSTVKKNWNKDVTGRTEDMCWNSAYLFSTTNVDHVLKRITEIKSEAAQLGWEIEATGPWPAYHFANLS